MFSCDCICVNVYYVFCRFFLLNKDLPNLKTYVKQLTFLINMSITQGNFPNELKIARVIPLYKGEDTQLIENYRPISVLP